MTATSAPTTSAEAPGEGRAAVRLRRALRVLAGLHLLLAAGALAAAGLAVQQYSSAGDDDSLAGLALLVAAALAAAAAVQVALALPVVLVRRRPHLAAGLAIPAGLWGLVAMTPSLDWLVPGPLGTALGVVLQLVPLALVGCGIAALVVGSRAPRRPATDGGWGTV